MAAAVAVCVQPTQPLAPALGLPGGPGALNSVGKVEQPPRAIR